MLKKRIVLGFDSKWPPSGSSFSEPTAQTIKLPKRVLQQRVAGIRTCHISDPHRAGRSSGSECEFSLCFAILLTISRLWVERRANIMCVTLTFGARVKDTQHTSNASLHFLQWPWVLFLNIEPARSTLAHRR
jgi:hypothetical protein